MVQWFYKHAVYICSPVIVMKKKLVFLILAFIFETVLHAQGNLTMAISKLADTKVRIAWNNPYGDSVVQLNVQRSWDSTRNFMTIFVPLSPELPQNGYVDQTDGYNSRFYRIFYVLADGRFFFTKSKKNATGSDFTNDIPEDKAADKSFLITIHDDDTIIAQLSYDNYKKFRDSIVNYTRDTLYSLTDADVLIRYYNNNIKWIPSTHIFTTNDGFVQVYLTDALQKNYHLRFYDESHKLIFTIQKLPESQFLLDKTDFLHSGWFYFELLEDNKVRERNKFYIPKDF
jgi:hypothetical protein